MFVLDLSPGTVEQMVVVNAKDTRVLLSTDSRLYSVFAVYSHHRSVFN